jgi:hypothetical protein
MNTLTETARAKFHALCKQHEKRPLILGTWIVPADEAHNLACRAAEDHLRRLETVEFWQAQRQFQDAADTDEFIEE